MGITSNCAKFLFFAKAQGVSFSNTVTLGRQQQYVSSAEIQKLAERAGLSSKGALDLSGKYAESLFSLLGAVEVESLDFSPYEQATLLHDLNFEIPVHLRNKFTAVFDGGTLEHVYNFPVAIQNCMDMLTVGGHFISISPANNLCGHGFYQFSPELYFSLFSEKAGFKVKKLFVAADIPGRSILDWFEVSDPKVVGDRVMLTNAYPTYLMLIAEKTAAGSVVFPFQSDYESVWQQKGSAVPSRWNSMYRKYIPQKVRDYLWLKFKSSQSEHDEVRNLGNVNPRFFKKIDY